MKVLILGVTNRAGLSILRKLAREGITVIGADVEQYPWQLHSKYSKQYYTYKYDTSQNFITTLQSILQDEKPDVLIPIKHTKELVEHREQIERYTNLLLPEQESYKTANDNYKTLQECQRLGIPSPQVYSVEEAKAILEKDDDVQLVIKPRLDFGGAKGVNFIKKPSELDQCISDIKENFGEFIIQEYIPGNPQSMHAISLLFNRSSKLLTSFCFRKIRQSPLQGGLTAHSISVHDRDSIKMVLPFFEKWKWQGPADVEFKIDARDNTAKLIEINPRYSGNIIFAINSGVSFHLYHTLAALGRSIDDECFDSYDAGIKSIWPYYYLKSLFEEFRQGEKIWTMCKREAKSLQGTKFYIRENLFDILPVIGFVLRLIKNQKK